MTRPKDKVLEDRINQGLSAPRGEAQPYTRAPARCLPLRGPE